MENGKDISMPSIKLGTGNCFKSLNEKTKIFKNTLRSQNACVFGDRLLKKNIFEPNDSISLKLFNKLYIL